MLELIASIFVLIYTILLITYYLKISKNEIINIDVKNINSFSIIIPFRNEANNLNTSFKSISSIKYDTNLFEVIYVDDNSTDNSFDIISDLIENNSFKNISVIKSEKYGKKGALETGIKTAKYDYIITTDADCEHKMNWLAIFNYYLNENPRLKFIAGGIYLSNNNSFFQKSQTIEMAGLQSVTQIGFLDKNPTMCNGANLCYSKHIFNEVNGYQDVDKNSSGDDEFLMSKIHQKYPHDMLYSNANDIIVTTNSEKNLFQFLNQRKRWASKIFYRNINFTFFVSLFVYFFHFSFLYILYIVFFQFTIYALIIVLFKFIVEYYFLNKSAQIFNEKKIFNNVLKLQFLYSIYVIFVGLSLVHKRYSWKGRVVK